MDGIIGDSRSHPPWRSRSPRGKLARLFFDDVGVGTISVRSGNPIDTDPWEWHCGFYSGSLPGKCTTGTAPTFEAACAEFESAWRVFLANRTEADFQAWRKSTGAHGMEIRHVGCRLPVAETAPGRAIALLLRRADFDRRRRIFTPRT